MPLPPPIKTESNKFSDAEEEGHQQAIRDMLKDLEIEDFEETNTIRKPAPIDRLYNIENRMDTVTELLQRFLESQTKAPEEEKNPFLATTRPVNRQLEFAIKKEDSDDSEEGLEPKKKHKNTVKKEQDSDDSEEDLEPKKKHKNSATSDLRKQLRTELVRYDGSRNVVLLDNFCRRLETYFRCAELSELQKVLFASSLL